MTQAHQNPLAPQYQCKSALQCVIRTAQNRHAPVHVRVEPQDHHAGLRIVDGKRREEGPHGHGRPHPPGRRVVVEEACARRVRIYQYV